MFEYNPNSLELGVYKTYNRKIIAYYGSEPYLLRTEGEELLFLYRVENLAVEDIDAINSMFLGERVNAIVERGGTIHFDRVENENFRNNLVYADTLMEPLLGEILLEHFKSGEATSSLRDCTKKVANEARLPFINADFYEYKVRVFLELIAYIFMPLEGWDEEWELDEDISWFELTSLRPTQAWDGGNEEYGYMIVYRDKEKDKNRCVEFSPYNRYDFSNTLYFSSVLVSPYTEDSSSCLYQERGKTFISLPFQLCYIEPWQ